MMFVREMEEFAVTLARKGSLAYTDIAKADPIGSFRFFNDVCQEAYQVNKKYPGFYQMFCEAMDAEKAKFA